MATTKTYVSRSAGSTTIMPDGTKIQFGKGALGVYVTDNPAEQEWLDSLCKSPTSQITLEGEKARVDPAIEQAVKDAEANTVLEANPAVQAARDKIAAAQAAAAASLAAAGGNQPTA